MAGKIIQMEMVEKTKPSIEEVMIGMMKGLFARDQQRDTDIKKLMVLIMDSNTRIDETKQQITNIVEYESLHRR